MGLWGFLGGLGRGRGEGWGKVGWVRLDEDMIAYRVFW